MEFIQRLYTSEGRLPGSYVYFLCCAADSKDFVYIKVGISDRPTHRLYALVNGCGLRPLTFGTVNVRSRRIAQKIETDLHRAYAAWRTGGEWYRFSKDDKVRFAQIRKAVLAPHEHPGWPLPVIVSGVMAVMKNARHRSLFYTRLLKHKHRGKSYQDYRLDGGKAIA